MLNILQSLPTDFLSIDPHQLETILPGPSLIYLNGREQQPLFISTLLHGNETSGFKAIQKLLSSYQQNNKILPRSLILFIGNISAAAKGERFLPDQLDYNRIWGQGNRPEHLLAQEVMEKMRTENLFAAIDIHNNTGKNPLYACINKVNTHFLYLARLFSRTIVYFTEPHQALCRAFSNFCPAITIECSQSGNQPGIDRAVELINDCLHANTLLEKKICYDDVDLYHTISMIKLPKESRISFDKECLNNYASHKQLDFYFREDIDRFNFTELHTNTCIGWRFNPNLNLSIIDKHNQNVTDEYIFYQEQKICLKKAIIPAMLTTDVKIIHQDCFGYFMQRYSLSETD